MWTDAVAPRLPARFALRPVHTRTVKTFGIGESAISDLVDDLLTTPGDGVEAGIYARDDGVHLRFSTRGDAAALDPPVARALSLLGDHVYGTDDDDLASLALAALGRAGAATVATSESRTQGVLMAILSAVQVVDGAAGFIGGVLEAGGAGATLTADALIQLALLAPDAHGRSRIRVSVEGAVSLATVEVRVHGSGQQRLRRAAFAALDQVRRAIG